MAWFDRLKQGLDRTRSIFTGQPAASAARATGAAVSRNGPAALITTRQPANARASAAGASIAATRNGMPWMTDPRRPTATTRMPRRVSADRMKRPVCPVAP